MYIRVMRVELNIGDGYTNILQAGIKVEVDMRGNHCKVYKRQWVSRSCSSGGYQGNTGWINNIR